MGRAAILPLIWFSRRLAAVVVIEEASYVREKNNTKYSRPEIRSGLCSLRRASHLALVRCVLVPGCTKDLDILT